MSQPAVINPMDDVNAANAMVDSLLSDSEPVDLPVITPPEDGVVDLPGGLFNEATKTVSRTAIVRELNGNDEETIYKARRSGNPIRFINSIITSGLVSVGDTPANPEIMKNLLVGDREAILLGIRRATYGDDIELSNFVCPGCEAEMDLSIALSSIPVKRLDDPDKDRYFKVKLWKGGEATVALPTGADMEAIMVAADKGDASKINTVTLARSVVSIKEANGYELPTVQSEAAVARLGLKDRSAILNAMYERQPGPRYDEVTYTHETCGKETPLPLSVGDLFREL